jgi:signal transduction histidine kinase
MSTPSEPDTQENFEESAEELYEDAPCGYVSYLPSQGTIVRMNRTLARWLGHDACDWVGTKRFQALLSAPARLAHETRHLPMLRMRGAVSGLALEMLRADSERMPVLVTSQLRYDAGGVPTLVRTTIFDASAYSRYERQLVEERDRAQQAADEAQRARAAADGANEAKSRFLAAMNHEYRTPINIIAGFAELLADPGLTATDAEKAEYLGEMRAASLHLLGLLEDATRYGRLDELERSPHLGPARLRSLAVEGLRLARPVIDARAVRSCSRLARTTRKCCRTWLSMRRSPACCAISPGAPRCTPVCGSASGQRRMAG